MSTINKIKEELNNSIDHAKMKMDVIQVQAALGKAELDDNIREKRQVVADSAAQLSDKLTEVGVSAGEVKDNIEEGVDNLKLQVALGKMEGKECAIKAKDELTHFAGVFESALNETQSIEEEKVEQVKEKMADYLKKVSSLKATMEAKVASFKD